jgi:hypothetical protein
MDIHTIDQIDINYTNIFNFEALQNLPKLGFLVWNHLAILIKIVDAAGFEHRRCPDSALHVRQGGGSAGRRRSADPGSRPRMRQLSARAATAVHKSSENGMQVPVPPKSYKGWFTEIFIYKFYIHTYVAMTFYQ